MRKALVTGGSKGFGLAVARELDRTEWEVIIAARSNSDLAAAASGTGIRVVAADVRSEEDRATLAATVGDRLDLLVNNASYLGPSPLRTIGDVSADDLHAVFDTNVVAPLALLGLVLPALERSGGVVVNVTSDAAVMHYERWGPYGAAKAALDHATAVLALEYPGVTAYAFDPGDMRTEMHQAAFPGEDIGDRPLPESVVPALVQLVESTLPSGRFVAADMTAASAP